MGLAAAINAYVKINDESTYTKHEFYKDSEAHFDTLRDKYNDGTYTSSGSGGNGKGIVTVDLKDDGTINDIDLYIILDGADVDCNTAAAAAGIQIKITIEFDAPPTE